MQSPTQLETEQLYPLNAYGSAMSPLFINLTLWIGVFMLMVIMHIEVDDEEIRNLTIAQRFLGRGILFAIMVSLQAIVCVTGCLFLGVQAENVAALYMTAVACSLTYLAIQYTLSTTLQHVGKGLCVILVFVQIPGATGLYPVELTTSFFQTVYPIFPVHVWHQRHARMHLRFLRKYVAWLHGRACVVLRSFPVHRHICAPLPHEP